jgi:hypothetical protein
VYSAPRWIGLTHATVTFGVMSLAFRVENMEVEGKTLRCGVLELENAVVALFWEGEEPKLGSTTVTLPGMASTQLLGDRDQLIGRVLGTHLAAKYGKMALVSTHISKGYGEEMGKTLLELARRFTEEKS